MKLYMHPASTTCRPILLFLHQNNIDIDTQVVDLLSGEHKQAAYAKVNPNCMVPALVDGDFVLTESSAILKYLADKFETPDYPRDLQARARINERMDWFNANLYRDLGYNLVYPQLFPHHKRSTDAGNAEAIAWGVARTQHWLTILDRNLLGDHPYLCGNKLSIADYFGACLLELGVAVGNDNSKYPNVDAWLTRMRALPGWQPVHEVFYGFVTSLKDQVFKAA